MRIAPHTAQLANLRFVSSAGRRLHAEDPKRAADCTLTLGAAQQPTAAAIEHCSSSQIKGPVRLLVERAAIWRSLLLAGTTFLTWMKNAESGKTVCLDGVDHAYGQPDHF